MTIFNFFSAVSMSDSTGRTYGDKVREALLGPFGHVQKRNSAYIGGRRLKLELPGRRQRGRPKRRFVGAVREVMLIVGMGEDGAEDNARCRMMIHSGE